ASPESVVSSVALSPPSPVVSSSLGLVHAARTSEPATSTAAAWAVRLIFNVPPGCWDVPEGCAGGTRLCAAVHAEVPSRYTRVSGPYDRRNNPATVSLWT